MPKNTRRPVPPGLPPHAKPVFKGILFDVWHWEQKMFDGSTETFERIVRPDTVSTIATAGDKIIIEEQEQPARESSFFSLPGGVADHGESPLDEAKREFLEETGYASDDWEFWQHFLSTSRVIWTSHYFIARNCRKIQEPHLDAGEKIALRFLPFDEFLMLSEDPKFRGVDIANMLFRVRLSPVAKKEFRKLLFP